MKGSKQCVRACATAKFSDPLSIELLQLATLLMRCYTVKLSSSECRQQLLKFSWGYLKTPRVDRDTSPCKYFAFLNVCHFLETFPAPDKIYIQVSLRRYQPKLQDWE